MPHRTHPPQPSNQQQILQPDDNNFISQPLAPSQPLRDNTTFNLSVLRRHNSSISQILSIAPYAVIYTFSLSTQAWEKTGVEGTLFVCRLSTSNTSSLEAEMSQDGIEQLERYSVFVLNRRGLENFDVELLSEDDVELTEEYVILQGRSVPHGEDDNSVAENERGSSAAIYGLWIFAEPPPSSTAEMRTINARVIHDCAVRAERSRRIMQESKRTWQPLTDGQTVGAGMGAGQDRTTERTEMRRGGVGRDGAAQAPLETTPMTRQLSLRELFGQPKQQRGADSVPMQLDNHAQPRNRAVGDASVTHQDGSGMNTMWPPQGVRSVEPFPDASNVMRPQDLVGEDLWGRFFGTPKTHL